VPITVYFTLLASHCFMSCKISFTRIENKSATCTLYIDHIFVKNFSIDNIIIRKCDIADHFATIINIDNENVNYNHTKKNLKQYNKIDFLLLNT